MEQRRNEKKTFVNPMLTRIVCESLRDRQHIWNCRLSTIENKNCLCQQFVWKRVKCFYSRCSILSPESSRRWITQHLTTAVTRTFIVFGSTLIQSNRKMNLVRNSFPIGINQCRLFLFFFVMRTWWIAPWWKINRNNYIQYTSLDCSHLE